MVFALASSPILLSCKPESSIALSTPAIAGSASDGGHAKLLSCWYGGIGEVPSPLPSGYETEFAVAEVEIESPKQEQHVTIPGFVIVDGSGKVTRMKRVVEVRVRDEGRGESWQWNGTLPVGTVHLVIEVSLRGQPRLPSRCRVIVGPYIVQSTVDGEWPT